MTVPALISETWTGLLDLVYPPKCLICGTLGPEIACGRCLAGFHGLEPPICPRCGAMIGHIACKYCANGLPKFLKRVRTAGQFEGKLREAIHNLKYLGKRKLAVPLARFLVDFLREKPFGRYRFDVIVPIPLHPSRLREREFNQSALIAQFVSIALEIPICETGLVRRRRTKSQAGLKAKDRVRNVQGAFAVVDPLAFRDKSVLLIDDVITTASTVDSCAEVILSAGATVVYAAAVARDI